MLRYQKNNIFGGPKVKVQLLLTHKISHQKVSRCFQREDEASTLSNITEMEIFNPDTITTT